MTDSPAVITPAKIRFAAMDLLSGREVSRAQLAEKLNKRFDKDSAIGAVLDQLEAEGLQCDRRFTETFVRSRLQRGQGLARIQEDLREKGICPEHCAFAVENAEIDWFALAREVADRKFGRQPAVNPKEKAKRARFLVYRGFNIDQIKHAIREQDLDEFQD